VLPLVAEWRGGAARVMDLAFSDAFFFPPVADLRNKD